MHIINNFVLFEMNIAIRVYNDVVLHLIWFVNTVFVIRFLLCGFQVSAEHLQLGNVST